MSKSARAMCRILTLLLIALIAYGCGKPKQDTLIGKWYGKDDDAIYEFFDDGTLTLIFEAAKWSGQEPPRGKWVILKDGKLKIDASIYGTPLNKVFLFDIKDNELVLTETDGSASYHHKRVIVEQGVAVYAPQSGAPTEP